MSTQSYPWLKMPHRQYLVSITYAALKPVERLAFLELAMYAHTQANNQLPDNDLALAGWADMSVKQWLKVKANVFSEWLLKDGFWLLPSWFVVESAPVVKRESEQDDEPKKAMTNAERQAAYKARQAELALLAEQSNITGNGEVTEGNDISNAQVTTGNGASNEKVTTGNAQVTDVSLLLGGRGEDLDSELKQDLELNQEVKNSLSQNVREEKNKLSQNFFDDELKPNLKVLNDKFIGEIVVTQEMIDSQLFLFNAHYETQQLTDNQRLAKWVSWIKRKQADEKIAETRSQKITVTSRRTPTPDNFAAKNYSAGINTDGSF
jgi:uncharacterized protein YdaU (DUF1376 family)